MSFKHDHIGQVWVPLRLQVIMCAIIHTLRHEWKSCDRLISNFTVYNLTICRSNHLFSFLIMYVGIFMRPRTMISCIVEPEWFHDALFHGSHSVLQTVWINSRVHSLLVTTQLVGRIIIQSFDKWAHHSFGKYPLNRPILNSYPDRWDYYTFQSVCFFWHV